MIGVFEHSYSGLVLHALPIITGVLITAYISFQFLGFKNNVAMRFVITMGITLANIASIDFALSMLVLEYRSIFFGLFGGPSLFLIIYMVVLGAASISLELSVLEKAIDEKYQVESEWYFAYKIISICFFLVFWILLFVMQKKKRK